LDPVALKVGITPEMLLEKPSLRVMVTVEVEVPSGFTGPVPMIVEFVASAGPAVNTIAAPDLLTGVKICGVLLSAFVDFSVQVDVPAASVGVHAV
jgi:hypothetical protein